MVPLGILAESSCDPVLHELYDGVPRVMGDQKDHFLNYVSETNRATVIDLNEHVYFLEGSAYAHWSIITYEAIVDGSVEGNCKRHSLFTELNKNGYLIQKVVTSEYLTVTGIDPESGLITDWEWQNTEDVSVNLSDKWTSGEYIYY